MKHVHANDGDIKPFVQIGDALHKTWREDLESFWAQHQIEVPPFAIALYLKVYAAAKDNPGLFLEDPDEEPYPCWETYAQHHAFERLSGTNLPDDVRFAAQDRSLSLLGALTKEYMNREAYFDGMAGYVGDTDEVIVSDCVLAAAASFPHTRGGGFGDGKALADHAKAIRDGVSSDAA